MALPIREVEKQLPGRHTSSTTGDFGELPVIEADCKYRTCIVSVLDAPPHFV